MNAFHPSPATIPSEKCSNQNEQGRNGDKCDPKFKIIIEKRIRCLTVQSTFNIGDRNIVCLYKNKYFLPSASGVKINVSIIELKFSTATYQRFPSFRSSISHNLVALIRLRLVTRAWKNIIYFVRTCVLVWGPLRFASFVSITIRAHITNIQHHKLFHCTFLLFVQCFVDKIYLPLF